MGNCRNTNCVKPVPLYKQVLTDIFHNENEALNSQNSSLPTQMEAKSYENSINPQELFDRVKGSISQLVDFLHNNKNKLKDVGIQIEKVITSSRNPQINLVGLYLIEELLKNIDKFKYDGKDLKKMISFKERREGHFREKLSDIVAAEAHAQSSMENIILFENSSLEVFLATISNQNQFRVFLFKYLINTLNLFFSKTKTNLNRAIEKIERIVAEIVEIVKSNKESAIGCDMTEVEIREKCLQIMLIIGSKLSSSKLASLLIDFTFVNLAFTYVEANVSPSIQEERKAAIERINHLALQIIETVTKSSVEGNHLVDTISLLLEQFETFSWNLGLTPVDIMKKMIQFLRATRLSHDLDIDVIKTVIDIELTLTERSSSGRLLGLTTPLSKNNLMGMVGELLQDVNSNSLNFLFIDKVIFYLIINYRLADAMENSLTYKTKIEEVAKTLLSLAETSSTNLNNIVKSLAQNVEIQYNQNNSVKRLLQFCNFMLRSIRAYPSPAALTDDALNIFLRISNDQQNSSPALHIIFLLLGMMHRNEAPPARRNSPNPYLQVTQQASEGTAGFLSISSSFGKRLLGQLISQLLQNHDAFESLEKGILEDFYSALLNKANIIVQLMNRRDKIFSAQIIAFLLKVHDILFDTETTTVCYYNNVLCFLIHSLKNVAGIYNSQPIMEIVNKTDNALLKQPIYGNIMGFLAGTQPININIILSHKTKLPLDSNLTKQWLLSALTTSLANFFGAPGLYNNVDFANVFNELDNDYSAYPERKEYEAAVSEYDYASDHNSMKKGGAFINTPKIAAKPETPFNNENKAKDDSFDDVVNTLKYKNNKMNNILNIIEIDAKIQ